MIEGELRPRSALLTDEVVAPLVMPSPEPHLVYQAELASVTIPIAPQFVPIHIYEHFGQPLSTRERQVLTLSVNGSSETQISEALGIADQTVRNHRINARHKLGAPNLSDALVLGVVSGDLSLDNINPGEFELSRLGRLTERQRQIFTVLTEDNGFVPYKELARRLGIKEQTFKNLSFKIFKKLGIHGRRSALAVHLKANVIA